MINQLILEMSKLKNKSLKMHVERDIIRRTTGNPGEESHVHVKCHVQLGFKNAKLLNRRQDHINNNIARARG